MSHSLVSIRNAWTLVRISLFVVAAMIPWHFIYAATDISSNTGLMSGLVSYWQLEENNGTRQDSEGVNNLSDQNTPSATSGIIGYGVGLMRNESEFLENSSDVSISYGQTFSAAFWVKSNSEPESDSIRQIFSRWVKNTDGQYVALDYENSAGTYYLHYSVISGQVAERWVPVTFGSDWHHIVLTVDYIDNEVKLFVDNQLLDTNTSVDGANGQVGVNESYFVIGQSRDNSLTYGRYWDGAIDEVGLWNRALTPEEVTKLYNSGHGLPYTATSTHATSSVAFLPGIMGSRLYQPGLLGSEDKLWESISRIDISDLAMRDDGTSINSNIYTRDIIDNALPVTSWWSLGGEVYDGFLEYLDTLKQEQVIHDWEALPYDWRLSLEALRTQGSKDAAGNISYLTSTSTPFLLQELNRLADESPSGKVTIIAHSNGGIVAKYLLKKLEEAHDPLFNKIDKLILVGSPQLGTSAAVGELMHGPADRNTYAMREASDNMPGALQLLPSRVLLSKFVDPVVTFDDSVSRSPTFGTLAGVTIETYDELRDYLTGWHGTWEETSYDDMQTPNVLTDALVGDADDTHTGLDTWLPGNGLEIDDIIGVGVDTPYSVLYYDSCKKRSCWKREVSTLQHEYEFTRDGDGTVLQLSARATDHFSNYFVAFDRYNADEGENFKHKNMLSAVPVQELIRNMLLGDSSMPTYVTAQIPSVSGGTAYRFRVYSPVDMHLYDSAGHHTGVTTGTLTDLGRPYEEQLSNSYYREWGEVKYAGTTEGGVGARLVLDGTGSGVFRLEMDVLDGDTVQHTYVFADVPVTAMASGTIALTGSAPVLRYDVDGDGVVDTPLTPGASSSVPAPVHLKALKQTVSLSSMPAWLKAWIGARIDLAGKEIAKGRKGNLVAARAILETIDATIVRKTPTLIPQADADGLRVVIAALQAML